MRKRVTASLLSTAELIEKVDFWTELWGKRSERLQMTTAEYDDSFFKNSI